jgi:hypothetical protein
MAMNFATTLGNALGASYLSLSTDVDQLMMRLRFRAYRTGNYDEMNSILKMELFEDDDGHAYSCDTADNGAANDDFCVALASVTMPTQRRLWATGSVRPFATVLQTMVAPGADINWNAVGRKIIHRMQYRAYRTGNWNEFSDALSVELFEDRFGQKYSCDNADSNADTDFLDFCNEVAAVTMPVVRRLQSVMPFANVISQFSLPSGALNLLTMDRLLRRVQYRAYRTGDWGEIQDLYDADFGGQSCSHSGNSSPKFSEFCDEIQHLVSGSLRLL